MRPKNRPSQAFFPCTHILSEFSLIMISLIVFLLYLGLATIQTRLRCLFDDPPFPLLYLTTSGVAASFNRDIR